MPFLEWFQFILNLKSEAITSRSAFFGKVLCLSLPHGQFLSEIFKFLSKSQLYFFISCLILNLYSWLRSAGSNQPTKTKSIYISTYTPTQSCLLMFMMMIITIYQMLCVFVCARLTLLNIVKFSKQNFEINLSSFYT